MTASAKPTAVEAASLPEAELQDLLRRMISARVTSTRCFNLQRQGRLGTMAPIDGAEAAVVGSARALDPTHDWILPQYREYHGLLRFGDEILERFLRYLRGDPSGGYLPEPIRVWPPQIALAAQIPHAVGMAWGLKLRGEPGVALCYFGDGASSEGDFYEGCNFAGVLDLPVIFLCINNGWAISTPISKQTRAESVAAKAAGFGIAGVTVDGCDVEVVYNATLAARERALAGDGPTLIEAIAYRLGPHTTADDPGRYVPAEEIEAARGRDPIDRLRSDLTTRGAWSDEMEEQAKTEADERMDRALEAAEAHSISPDAFFDHLYSEPTPRMERQRAQLLEALERKGSSDA